MPISFIDLIYNYTCIFAHIGIQIAFKDAQLTKNSVDPYDDAAGLPVLSEILTRLNNSYKSSIFAGFLLTFLIKFSKNMKLL